MLGGLTTVSVAGNMPPRCLILSGPGRLGGVLLPACAQLLSGSSSVQTQALPLVPSPPPPVLAFQVSVLIRYLLSMRGRRLWAYEDADPSVCPTDGAATAALPSAAALSAMVGAVHDALAFEVGLQVRNSGIGGSAVEAQARLPVHA